MSNLVERVARAMEGPHRTPPANSPWSLEHLRDLRWSYLSNHERKDRLRQARAAIAVIHAAMQDIPPEAVRAMIEAFSEGREPMRDAARALADAMFKEEGNG